MSPEVTSLTNIRPTPVIPVASDPSGPVIIKYTVLASYLITFILGLAGNTLVLYVVSRYSSIRNRSVSNYYIWNLALADELFVLALPFFCYATWTGDWIFGSVACKVINLFTTRNNKDVNQGLDFRKLLRQIYDIVTITRTLIT